MTAGQMRKAVMALAAATFVAIAAAAIFLAMKGKDGPVSPAAVNVAGADIGGPFTLTDQNGRQVTDKDVITGPTLIYFGYTFCPDICPVDVATMAEAVDLLAEQGYAVKPVFITVDPARDTPEVLKDYADAMHPGMVALSGTEAETKAVAKEYKVYYQRVDQEGAAGYLMNHTTFTYFMMPDGIHAMFRDGFPPKEIAGEVARILGNR